jgi:hypothetical protein
MVVSADLLIARSARAADTGASPLNSELSPASVAVAVITAPGVTATPATTKRERLVVSVPCTAIDGPGPKPLTVS